MWAKPEIHRWLAAQWIGNTKVRLLLFAVSLIPAVHSANRQAQVKSSQLGPCSFMANSTLDPCFFDMAYPETNLSMFSWELSCGTDAFWVGGPTVDNGRTVTGGYAFIDPSVMADASEEYTRKAWLPSTVLNATLGLGKCLQFAYSSDGLSVGGLRILVNATDVTYAIWETFDLTEGKWSLGKVTYTCDSDYRLIFESFPREPHYSRRGYVAVDDVVLFDGPCPGDCTFDQDFCSWGNVEGTDDFDWQLGRGSGRSLTGPERDHGSSITRRRTGGYAFIDSSYPQKPGDSAQLWSPALNYEGRGGPICLSFWTSLYGAGIGALRIFVVNNSTNETYKVIWELYSGTLTPDQWYRGEVTLSLPAPFRVVFEAEVHIPGESDIALDDISLTNGTCPSVPREASKSGDCAFVVDMCSWQQKDGKTRESPPMWRRIVGDGTFLNPLGHSIVTGRSRQDSYMSFATSNYQHAPLDSSMLLSPPLPYTNMTYCLSFWAYMFSSTAGVPIGGLRVKVAKADGNTTTLWRLNNHQGSNWFYCQVALPEEFNTTDTVIIEAIKGGDTRAVIAVDDITFTTPQECPVTPAGATISNADCYFDREMCAWKVNTSTSANYRWRLPTGNSRPGTMKDHTFHVLGDGFIYMDVFSVPSPISSVLHGPELAGNTTYCLSFWFATLEQEDTALLAVQLTNSSGTLDLWRLTAGEHGSQPSQYSFGQVMVTSSDDYMVSFAASVQQSGFVLDDIKFYDTFSSCQARPAIAKP